MSKIRSSSITQNEIVQNSSNMVKIIDISTIMNRQYDPYGKCFVPPTPAAVIAEIKRELDAAKRKEQNIKDTENLIHRSESELVKSSCWEEYY
jgi:hypothetical protein